PAMTSRSPLLFSFSRPLLRSSTLFPYTTLFRSPGAPAGSGSMPRASADRLVDGLGQPVPDRLGDLGLVGVPRGPDPRPRRLLARDRKSTRLNSSHVKISYAVFRPTKKILEPKPL